MMDVFDTVDVIHTYKNYLVGENHQGQEPINLFCRLEYYLQRMPLLLTNVRGIEGDSHSKSPVEIADDRKIPSRAAPP